MLNKLIMNKLALIVLFILIRSTANASDTTAVFSASVKANFKKYISLSNNAYNKKDFEKAQQLFDSLVQNSLVGTQFDDFSFKQVGKKRLQLSKINKPTLIITYASWCIMGKGELPALNKLAAQYKDKIQIVVLFWNKKNEMKKIARKFNSDIKVCYAHETERKDYKAITLLKKTLGFPTMYFLDHNLEVVDIQRSFVKPESKIDIKTSIAFYYQKFNNGISNLVISDTSRDMGLAKN